MSRRRGNQEGSIHFRREDGTWRAQIMLEGKRLSFTAKTRQECQTWLKKTISQIDTGLSFLGANMKLSEYMEIWLRTIKENRRPKTYIQYRQIVDTYILPKFGNVRLRDLHPLKIESYLTAKQEEGIGDRTTQIIYSVLHSALSNATKKGLIGRNPLNSVDKPKVRNPRKITILTIEQVQQFLIAADGGRAEALYHLVVVTGLREGEILALQWSDIDWQKGHLKVQRQVQRITGEGLVFYPPKTEAGIRTIALGQITLVKLQEHRKRQELEKELAGNRWKENNLIFPTPIGTPIDPRNLLNDFRRVLERAGLPHMRFHDLRHTSITLILNEIGAPIKEAQRRAGHTRPSTTIDIYGGEATSKLDEIVAQGLDDLITPVKVKLHRNCTEEKSLPYK